MSIIGISKELSLNILIDTDYLYSESFFVYNDILLNSNLTHPFQ